MTLPMGSNWPCDCGKPWCAGYQGPDKVIFTERDPNWRKPAKSHLRLVYDSLIALRND